MSTSEAEVKTLIQNEFWLVVDHVPQALDLIVRSIVDLRKRNIAPDAGRELLQRIYKHLHSNANPVGRLHYHHWEIQHCQNNDAFAADVTDEDAEAGTTIVVLP